jgi:multiple sugar transport system ATP-binding protein
MIAGLEEISGGVIKIGGREVNHVPPKDRDVAMVFQNYALYPHMTVYDNMAFSLKLRKAAKTRSTSRVRRRPISSLCAAAAALSPPALGRPAPARRDGPRHRARPQVFLFDEPLSNLDAKLRVAMRTEIKALHQRLKTTTVYVTHDQSRR